MAMPVCDIPGHYFAGLAARIVPQASPAASVAVLIVETRPGSPYAWRMACLEIATMIFHPAASIMRREASRMTMQWGRLPGLRDKQEQG